MPAAPIVPWLETLRKLPLLRILLVGLLVLLLQIPIAMIDGLIGGRRSTRDEAVKEVTGKWGAEQTILGPVLAVPYLKRWTEEKEPGKVVARSARHEFFFLPEVLRIEGKAETEIRYRGIFKVAVYRLTTTLAGSFAAPDLGQRGIAPGDVLWDRAEIWVGVSDARAIQNQAALTWAGAAVPFAPGTGEFGGERPGIHAALPGALARRAAEFSIPLVLNGSEEIAFAPLGEETRVRLAANWSDPSFQGNWLPTRREVGPAGFTAEWDIPSLGRNYPQAWTSESPVGRDVLDKSEFGFRLLDPVDLYRMTERSTKYEALFLLFTFLTLWLLEVLNGHRVHSVHYLLVGSAMCVFYLLELSLAEHLGFTVAYLVASLAVIGLIASYSAAVLQGARRAAIVGGVVAALYAFLYVLLNNQDYALLVGAVGLFVILALVMYLTRNVDWSRLGT